MKRQLQGITLILLSILLIVNANIKVSHLAGFRS